MGVDVQIHIFLTSALVESEWSASRSSRFAPWFPLDRKLGGPQSRSGRRGEEIILDPTGARTPENAENCMMSFIIGASHQMLLGLSSQWGWDGKEKQHAWKRTEMHTKFLVVTPYKKTPRGRPSSRQYNKIKMYLKKNYDTRVWYGLDSSGSRQGPTDGLLWRQ
jgi:hypothetical protein